MEAIRHAQAARDWDLAAGLLADHWPGLHLDGQAATIHELLAGFPPGVRAADAGLAAVAAADELVYGSLEAAEWCLGLAERGTASVPDALRAQAQLLIGIVRLLVVRQRGDLLTVAEEARRLEALAEAPDATQPSLGQDLRALALISLGITEVWTGRFQEAERHLEQGVTLAHQIGRPFLEFAGLAHQAAVEMFRSYARAAERAREAMELAERHGWASDPAAGTACMALGTMLTWQGRLDEAEPWVQRAERTLTADAQPATGHVIRYLRGLLELARGRDADALAAFRAAEPLARRLPAPHYTVPRARALLVHALVRLGDTEGAEQALAELGSQDREHGETRIATAALRLAHDDPHAAIRALAPVLDGARAVLPMDRAGSRVPAGRDRPRRARRPGRRRAGPGTRTRPRRTRRRANNLPAAPSAGSARAPRPARHRPRGPDRRDPGPARREQARAAARQPSGMGPQPRPG